MLSVEEAQQQLLSAIQPLAIETVPLAAAFRRVTASDLHAQTSLPQFDNSAMDGYAVRADDVAKANAAAPVRLALQGKVPAGQASGSRLEPGHCIRIFTGSPLPEGSDAVVMQEDAEADPKDARAVHILESAKPWENVRFAGEDVREGELLLRKGDVLTAQRLALLAATGLGEVQVWRRPRVTLLATGNELREPPEKLGLGQIYESNRVALAAALEQAGAEVRIGPIIPDELWATRAALAAALAHSDAVVTSGGVSVGEFDFIKEAWQAIGGELGFWRVSMKPGKPFVFGQCGGKWLFGLPGNPASAFVTFTLLVAPAIAKLQGSNQHLPKRAAAILGERLSNPGTRRHFVRVRFGPNNEIVPAGRQGSHFVSSLAAAEGLVDVAPQSTVEAGTPVEVILL